MQKVRQYFFIILLIIATVLLGYNYMFRPFEVTENPVQKASIPEQKTGESTSKEILETLTAQEKVMQMIAYPVTVKPEFTKTEDLEVKEATVSGNMKLPQTIKPGFFTIFGKGVSFVDAENEISNLKNDYLVANLSPLVAVDHEGGSVQRLSGEGFSKLDSWQSVCGFSVAERQAVLKQTARELKNVGIDIVLGPVLDVGSNRILKDRVCSIDSYAIVADRSMDYVTNFLEVGILPVLKHFPGIGLTQKDLHTSFDYVEVLENDVKLYKYVIDQVDRVGVMTSHVGVVSQDREIPCSVSPYCVSELNQAYPNVLVFTDALEMSAASYDKNNPRVAKDLTIISKQAVLAGNDVLLYGEGVSSIELSEIVSQLTYEYNSNPQFKSFVDKSVLKIIEYKQYDQK